MGKIDTNDVRKAIADVTDPDIGQTLEELDAIENIDIKDNVVNIHLKIVPPIQWVAKTINDLCVDKLKDVAPDHECEISISEKPVKQHGNEMLKNVKNIVAVASGKGGVGKSAIASNLAAALSMGGIRVGILDGDVYGPSQPTMFGLSGRQLEAAPGPEGKPVAKPIDKNGVKVASMGFVMEQDQAAIVRGPMLAGYFSMLFEQVDWGTLDVLLFDLPPGTGDIQLTLTQKIPLTGAVVVTTPQEISLADVRRSIAMFRRVDVDILGIVENMSYFIPPDAPDKKYYIFGEGGGSKMAKEMNTTLLGEVPLNQEMREGNDSGEPYVLNENAGQQGEIIKQVTANLVREIRRRNAASGEKVEIEI